MFKKWMSHAGISERRRQEFVMQLTVGVGRRCVSECRVREMIGSGCRGIPGDLSLARVI
jgi:hypothetical protein